MKISDLPDKEFKIMVMNMLTKVRKQCMNKVRISTKREYFKSTKEKSQS